MFDLHFLVGIESQTLICRNCQDCRSKAPLILRIVIITPVECNTFNSLSLKVRYSLVFPPKMLYLTYQVLIHHKYSSK